MALCIVAIMFGVMHDGSHRSISERGFWNRLGSSTLILAGASAISWRQEHVVRHHGRTNILDQDPDLETGGWLRYHPAQPRRPIHRYQHRYATLLYCLVALRWIWFEDFDDLLRNRYGLAPGARLLHAVEILVAKTCHVLLFLVVPALFWDLGSVFAFYLVHMAVVGLVMSLTFVLAHVGGEQAMYEDGTALPDEWTRSQLASTANFAVHNRALSWFVGGLNFQIEHHLFPGTSPKHYPKLLPVVKRWAEEEGLPYHEFPTVRAALSAHFRHLAALGR
jgi:linoleoyl-CoA desaturase